MKRFIINSVLVGTIGVLSLGNVSNVFAETVQSVEKYELVEGAIDISQRATFSISGIDMAPGDRVAYGSTFYINEEWWFPDVLHYDASWSPAGQNIRIGLKNVYTGEWYDTYDLKGGSATGSMLMLQVKSGEYEIYLEASADNVVNIEAAIVTLTWW